MITTRQANAGFINMKALRRRIRLYKLIFLVVIPQFTGYVEKGGSEEQRGENKQVDQG